MGRITHETGVAAIKLRSDGNIPELSASGAASAFNGLHRASLRELEAKVFHIYQTTTFNAYSVPSFVLCRVD